MGIFDCFKPHVKQEELPREEQEPLKPPENPLAPASVPAASAPCSALAAEALDGLQAALLSAPAHSWLSRISGLLCAFEDRGMCARLYGLVETASGLTDVDCDLVLIAVGAHAAAASAAALAVVAGAPGFGRRVPGRSSGSTIASATAVEEGVRMELLSQAHNVRAPATRVVYPRDTSAPSPPLAPAGCVTSPSGFRCIHMAAVPLMQGDRMVGALLLEERHTAPATAPVTSETHTSISILSTGLGPSNTHVPASGPRALAATRGNSTLSVFVAASGAAAAAGAATSGHMAPSPAAALLRDTDMLRALSFTASMCLVGSGSDKLLWLAQSVIRLRSAGSLQALVCELVEAVVEHVKRRFILDAYVGVAMVPPAHPQPSGTSAPTSDGSAPATAPSPLPQTEAKALLGLPLRLQPSTGSGAVCDVTGSCLDDAVDGAGETVGGGTGTPSASRRGRRSLLTPQMGRVSAPTVPTSATAAAAAAAVGATPGTAGAGASLAGVATTFNSTSPLSRAGPTGEADTAPSLRSISRFFSSLAGGAGAAAGAPNNGGSSHTPRPLSGAHYTAGLGSFAGRNLSAASVVIPLSAADVATVNAAAAGGGTAPAALHANAFPMQHTLLATVLALRQQEAAALRERERLLGIRSTPTVGGGGADTAALPAAAAVTATTSTAAGQAAAAAAAAAATAAVVDDIQLDVQGVHNPNRDVVLLCSVLAQANAAAGAHHPAPNTAAAGSHAAAAAGGPPGGSAAAQKRASTVSGMLAAAITSPIAGPTPNGANGAASGAAVAVTSGNFGTTATAALGSAAPGPPAPPQSLVLLTLSLDRTGASEPGGLVPPVPPSLAGGPAGGSSDAGAALGLYVCFAQRLPAALLEAVRESCQELIDQALAPPFRERLRGPLLAPEYELLKQAQVGTYAVLRGAGLGGPTALEDTHVVPTAVRAGAALLESLLGRSRRLATGGDAGGSMGTALSPSSMLTSSYLTTVDLDVMHAQQQDKTAAEAALRGSSSMRRASLLGMDPRQGDAGHMPGRTAGSSAAAAGQRALRIPSDTTGRSPSMTLARSVTLGLAAGATAASTSPSRIHTPNAGTAAGGEGRALLETGGSGLARTATMPAEDILDLLLGTGDLPTTGTGEGLTPGRSASIIHVTGVEAGGATAHKQMDLLVSSIHATIHASAVRNGATGGTFTSDLEQLELQEVLGRGGGGVVLKGLLNGTLQVAVKLMEMPDVEGEVDAAAAAAAAPPGPDGAPAPAAAPNPAKQLRARRELLRNAMELAVQGSASHPNIVQFYSTFNNVALRSRAAPDEQAGGITDPRSLYLEPAPPVPAETGDNEARVTCILAEYCDAGSLGAALQSRAFPRLARTPVRAAAYGVYSSSFMYDMKGVYMVLLDVALALRHLHSLHLVHRDVKPANLLLKSNPSDYRGFTVKLADFGFVLHLNEKGEDGSRFANVDQACGTVTHMAPECMPGKAKIDASVDIYSFGILCWDLLAGGARPFPHVHPDKIPRMVYKGARPTFSDNVPSAYRTLAQQCWGANPSRRPKANELVTIITQQLQAL